MIKKDTFKVRIDQLQPSQIYLSGPRLKNISRHTGFMVRPIPVRLLSGRLCIVEGHEQCFLVRAAGHKEIEVYLDERNSPSNSEFEALVKYASDKGIASIDDLEDRILSSADFRSLWLEKKKEFVQGKI